MMADDLSALPARKIAETRGNLLEMRATLSTPEGRVEGARKLQREAESTYAEERYALALRTQLSALWLLAPGEPALPRSLAEPTTPGLAALQAVICEEEQAAATQAPLAALPPSAEAGAAAAAREKAELRLALLLELANSALRLEDWPLARLACETVLARQPGAMGAHGTTADAHRKDYYSGVRASKHKQRQMEAGDVGDRFVLPPANPPPTQPKPMVMGGRESKAAMRKKPHPNAALIKDLRDNELRACYRATFGTDPGQLGKDKRLAAFLEKGAPRARIEAGRAPAAQPDQFFLLRAQQRAAGHACDGAGARSGLTRVCGRAGPRTLANVQPSARRARLARWRQAECLDCILVATGEQHGQQRHHRLCALRDGAARR